MKGADLACDWEGGAPDDTAVNTNVQVISGVGKSLIPLTYSKKAAFYFYILQGT